MHKFIEEHSLSLFILGMYLFFIIGLWVLPDGRLQAMFQGHADDTFGALIITVGARYFWEKDSNPEKKGSSK